MTSYIINNKDSVYYGMTLNLIYNQGDSFTLEAPVFHTGGEILMHRSDLTKVEGFNAGF